MKKEYNLIEKAARIAIIAHKDQKRKSDGFPYIIHPFMVALKLAKYNFPDEVIAAGLVHDVLEDTDISEEDLREELGDEVLEIVKGVSENKNLSWEERKRKYIETIKKAPAEVKAVSIADKIHNLEGMVAGYAEMGSDLWKKFNRGKEDQMWFINSTLQALKESWSHPLIDEYEYLVVQFNKVTKI